jgi:transcriptional regulator with GAF, ATPase, and Fis domain
MSKGRNQIGKTEKRLHEAEVESLEREIMELALEKTGARNGAIFLWDGNRKGLAIDFHVEDGVVVPLSQLLLRRRTDGRPNGIALHVLDENAPYLCNDTSKDAHYASYFMDVGSIVGVPIPYQGRAIGVITVSARGKDAFLETHVDVLQDLAASSAKFLRRAQLYRSTHGQTKSPFLIKGLSVDWMEVERKLENVSPTDATVLVTGESGTGKELVAHAVHFNSRRTGKPFVCVNCAAIPETMLESTLFGHVRGAFTGASYTRIGEFQKADGGTLFLDEVGEMPLPLQAKLLRAVENGEIQQLGSNKPASRVDVRLICATNRDLPAMIRGGKFREDLYFRIGVVSLDLPPLRTYKESLPVLAQAFLQQFNRRHVKEVTRITPGALALIHRYDYPGNVRELRNIIENAVVMAGSNEIRPEDLPKVLLPEGRAPSPAKAPVGTLRELRESWLEPLERKYLMDVLNGCNGNVRKAAKIAGINTVTFYRLLKKRGLKVERAVRVED